MLRSRRFLIGFVLALCLVVADPPQLDLVRYPLALVASWPARVLAAFFEPDGRDALAMSTESESHKAVAFQVFRSDSHFPVFRSDAERRCLFLVGGWDQKIAHGDRVVFDGQFLGFVDRVEERWCRVRILGHLDLHLGGSIELDGMVLEPGMHQQLLLSGSGQGSLVARQGSRIDPRLLGHEVRTIEDEELSESWTIGRIAFDERLDTEVVEIHVDLDALNEVQVLGRQPSNLRPCLDVEALVLAHGGGGSETKNWLLGRGRADGLHVGAWVSAGGVLVGRIIRCGFFSSRMLALADIDIQLSGLDPESTEALTWTPTQLPEHDLISRGRSQDASLPRGLLIPRDGRARPSPLTSEVLLVHVADDLQALLRLGVFR